MSDQAYVVGGVASESGTSNSTRVYDLSDNAWTSKTNMDYARKLLYFGSGAEVDGYAFGGNAAANGKLKCEQYDISANTWVAKADQVRNAGGASRPLLVGHIWADGMRYNIANNTWHWSSAGYQSYGHGAHMAFAVAGYIYSAQGYNYDWSIRTDPVDLSNITRTNLPAQRSDGGNFSDGTYGYIVGGRTTANEVGDTSCYRYDPSGNSWATRATMAVNVWKQAAFVISGQGHSIAGMSGATSSYTNYNGRYDNSGNSWTAKTVFPVAGCAVSGFAVPSNFAPNAPTALSVSDT